ncbi:MAG: 16S rRNA (cytosine(1402)-N(4))-methyltransferase RsmH [Rhodospirillaceae bacterium]|nr:16S rRNA (cytosine(1402)-N(4))-methyltransferase RsmH [Rhodospirillaceae bacterium]MYF85421.1 16S rRNA (cytosine(1402)-N(4))-methyltransferase RsmH [Rhodospirillaceae bacterium]MYH36957.1 16S rRNA (cytosine(1402)-N(4))-methyltransferase RsmH [Rhodospirillaceae bacterium]MYK12595.1 16S rRNA (cytosine(1402)-N(4))-methyltransferase RsmH [Rhodospirillaceae bacterium]MYK58156.1 16S rRNA (cytosine(1402)-N(4))-methyltransferase RsmH [Rhodospirillaceae bacterium]
MTAAHIPVLLNEVIRTLAPRSGGAYVDGTFGAGGYTEAILGAADCRVAAIDCDPDAIERGRALRDRYRGRLTLIEGRFGDMERLVRAVTDGPVDGVALDIGVSSPQLDTPERGFSFRHDGPLDMRMSRSGPTAADVVNRAAEADLSRIIFTLGEERAARRIARAIVNARRSAAIERTLQLAEIVRSVLPAAAGGIDPATRTFQALRLHVNGELEELHRGLRGAERLLRPGGRLAVVCFHSLEDRRVKRFLRDRSAEAPRGSRHRPEPGRRHPPTFRLLHRRAVAPSPGEISANPRARSSRLRAAERTDGPAWADNASGIPAGGAA